MTAPAALLSRLVADVNSLQDVPSGSYSCPADDGHGIVLVFRYQNPPAAIALWVPLAGCRFVGGLAGSKWLSEALTADLRTFVPSSWFSTTQ